MYMCAYVMSIRSVVTNVKKMNEVNIKERIGIRYSVGRKREGIEKS